MIELCGECVQPADSHHVITGECLHFLLGMSLGSFFRLLDTGAGGGPGSPPADTRWPRPGPGGASVPSGKKWCRADMEPGDAFRYVNPSADMPRSTDNVVVYYPGMPSLTGNWYRSSGAGTWPKWEVTPIRRFDDFLAERFREGFEVRPQIGPVEWPHKCDRCGAPGLHMAVSIICSKACCKDRK